MISIICQLSIYSRTPTKAIAFSQPLMEKWDYKNGQSIKVRIGNHSIITRVVKANTKDHKIFLSPTMAQQLYIPYSGPTRAAFINRTLRLGPVIGILTTGYTGEPSAPFGARTSLFKSFIQAGSSEKPFIYVFTPETVDWENKSIFGWYYHKDTYGNWQWIRLSSPFPDVVYERVPNRKAESLVNVKSCLEKFKEIKDIQIFNQGFFDKWSIHQMLNNNPNTFPYIPETFLSPSIQTIETMLDTHQMVYLKPSTGSLGMGIFRITRHPSKGYYVRYHEGKTILRRFSSLEKIIKKYFGSSNSDRFRKYLVQQGIRLVKYENRAVDFRVHMHKDSTGQWKVVAIGSKAAGTGCVTTHIRTGGSIIPTDEILQKIFRDKAKGVENAIVEAAIIIAESLEEKVEGPLGELGTDIGVDHNGKVWLFEINAKPGRHIFLHPSLQEAGRQSAKCITDFSLKLTNFI